MKHANSSLSGVWQRGEVRRSADHERDCEPCFRGGGGSDGGDGEVRRGQWRRGGEERPKEDSGASDAHASVVF